MSVMSSTSEIPTLQHYVQPVVASLDSSKTNEKKKALSLFVILFSDV
jgi:hypothetical protein